MRLINGIVWFGSNLAEEGFGCDKWTVLGGNLLYAQSSDHKIDNFPTVFFRILLLGMMFTKAQNAW
jgi:hypothetical protein